MALNNVPLAGQTLNATQAPINQNFSVIDTAFLVDHVAYNVSGQGKHNKVSFPTQNPVPAQQAGICQLYSQVSAFTTEAELVFSRQTGSTAPVFLQEIEFTSAGWSNPGWTRLPSGILLKWQSSVGFGGNQSITINVNTAIPGSPVYNTLLQVLVTAVDSNASYNNVIGLSLMANPNITISSFGSVNPPGTVTFNYLVIGY